MKSVNVPEDKYKFILRFATLMGLANLLPWQISILFSGTLFRNSKKCASTAAMASTLPYAITISLHALLGRKIPMNFRFYGSQVQN